VLSAFLDDRPGYTLDSYAAGEFYRDRDDLERVLEALRAAGMPE
jgi:hypothetical protein